LSTFVDTITTGKTTVKSGGPAGRETGGSEMSRRDLHNKPEFDSVPTPDWLLRLFDDIKATRDTERGEERFVARDDLIKAVHDYATVSRAALTAAEPQVERK
jgi:hypothetical protein